MRKPGTSMRAIGILACASAAAFAISTAAVSSATVSQAVGVTSVKYPFAAFSFTGGVSTARPSRPSRFGLVFTTVFTLSPKSQGLTVPATGKFGDVTIAEQVKYPMPGGSFVGPVRLPFRSESLLLTVTIKGSCFVAQPDGSFVFDASLRCVRSSLKLGARTYKVSALLRSVGGSFTPSPTGAQMWTGSVKAEFASPGYTFPVATLGSGGFTSLTIGGNGGKLATSSITFTG